MSDLRSQLISKLGVSEPEPAKTAPIASDPLGDGAHRDTEWYRALVPVVRQHGIKLNPQSSHGAALNAHNALMKKLKANGQHRVRKELNDLHSRYAKRREKTAWSRLKAALDAGGQSPKLYRAIKSNSVPVETVLQRWQRIKNKGLNGAEVRSELLGH
jgi:hypothetical protein